MPLGESGGGLLLSCPWLLVLFALLWLLWLHNSVGVTLRQRWEDLSSPITFAAIFNFSSDSAGSLRGADFSHRISQSRPGQCSIPLHTHPCDLHQPFPSSAITRCRFDPGTRRSVSIKVWKGRLRLALAVKRQSLVCGKLNYWSVVLREY